MIEQDTLEGDLSELVSNPKQIVAREEVVVIAAMILGIDVQDKDALKVFTDSNEISEWAQSRFAAIVITSYSIHYTKLYECLFLSE